MYNPAKAAQIIAYFALKSRSRSINVLAAMKLVYLSDRESLKRYGLPMLDEPRVSMKFGPVNSTTYDYAKGEEEDKQWSAVLTDRAHHMIGVKSNITPDDLDELSDAEVNTLDEIWAQFGSMSQWELANWTHDKDNVPEWQDPNRSSSAIRLERLLKAVGIKDFTGHAQFLRERDFISRIFANMA